MAEKQCEDAKRILSDATPQAASYLAGLVNSEDAAERQKFSAAVEILDRVFGKGRIDDKKDGTGHVVQLSLELKELSE